MNVFLNTVSTIFLRVGLWLIPVLTHPAPCPLAFLYYRGWETELFNLLALCAARVARQYHPC